MAPQVSPLKELARESELLRHVQTRRDRQRRVLLDRIVELMDEFDIGTKELSRARRASPAGRQHPDPDGGVSRPVCAPCHEKAIVAP